MKHRRCGYLGIPGACWSIACFCGELVTHGRADVLVGRRAASAARLDVVRLREMSNEEGLYLTEAVRPACDRMGLEHMKIGGHILR
jgi:hypothetical protein